MVESQFHIPLQDLLPLHGFNFHYMVNIILAPSSTFSAVHSFGTTEFIGLFIKISMGGCLVVEAVAFAYC